MNKNLNDKIKESIETRQLSENLFFISIACLNEKIKKSRIATPSYEKQREIIARAALDNGIDKSTISEMKDTISKSDYPTFKQITAITEIIEDGDYTFVSGFIPTKGHIHFKTEEEIQEYRKSVPAKKHKDILAEEFKELCDYLENDILNCSLTDSEKKSLQNIRTKEYSYSFMLDTVKMYRGEITRNIQSRTFQSIHTKWCYVVEIIKSRLPEMARNIKNAEKAEKMTLDALDDYAERLKHKGAKYQRKTVDDIHHRFDEYW